VKYLTKSQKIKNFCFNFLKYNYNIFNRKEIKMKEKPKLMDESWLVQRLLPPSPGNMIANAFSFGGGLINGGISNEGMDILNSLFRFDYMGSSEFEWGAVPKALQKIADQHNKYVAFEVSIKTEKNEAPIYIIAKPEWKEQIIKNLKKWASGDDYLKESVKLDRAINKTYFNGKQVEDYNLCIGWLELDNGYMFFINNKLFVNMMKLFSIDFIGNKEK